MLKLLRFYSKSIFFAIILSFTFYFFCTSIMSTDYEKNAYKTVKTLKENFNNPQTTEYFLSNKQVREILYRIELLNTSNANRTLFGLVCFIALIILATIALVATPSRYPQRRISSSKPQHLALPDAFTHCPRCGSANFEKQHESLRLCSDCNHQQHFNPVCATAAIISDKEGRILFIERGNEPEKGKLGLPGGFTDLDEDLETAVLREAKEEVGLDIYNLRYITSYPNNYPYQDIIVPTIDVFFSAQTEHFDVVAQEGEVSRWLLLHRDEIKMENIAFESMRVALKTYWKQEKKLAG